MAYERDDQYVEVKERIIEFRARYPEGRLAIKTTEIVNVPASADRRGNIIPPQSYILVIAQAFRDSTDTAPGEGSAWEPIPGRTPYTRDSELQNAETAAWGRALIALGAADATRGIASATEVRNRSYTHDEPQPQPQAQARQDIPRPAGAATRTRGPQAGEDTPWTAPAPRRRAPGVDAAQVAAWQGEISACAPADPDDADTLHAKRARLLAVRGQILDHVKRGVRPETVAEQMAAINRTGVEIKTLLGEAA